MENGNFEITNKSQCGRYWLYEKKGIQLSFINIKEIQILAQSKIWETSYHAFLTIGNINPKISQNTVDFTKVSLYVYVGWMFVLAFEILCVCMFFLIDLLCTYITPPTYIHVHTRIKKTK